MKISVLCFLAIVLFISINLCSARRRDRRRDRRTNIRWRGINHRSRNGRHNTNVNFRNVNYNYRGNQWNTNVRHNFRNRHTNLNANYRKNHNFNVGYNSRNRQANAGYKWNFGRRRRSVEAGDEKEFFRLEQDPKLFVEKLTLQVAAFVQKHQTQISKLELLTVIPVDDSVTNITVAKELVCLVKKLQRISPKTLGNFIVKMIRYHGPSFNITSLGDFFTVKPKAESEEDNFQSDNEEACETSQIESDPDEKEIESVELLEIKKFVASLIKVAMAYQQLLE